MKQELCDDRHCGQRLSKKGYCNKYKIPIKQVMLCVKVFKGGWISPAGKFTDSDFGSHDVDAEKIMEKQFPVIYNHLKEKWMNDDKKGIFLSEYCKDKIVEKGWVDLTGNPYPLMGFTEHIWAICFSEEKVTPQQHALIKKFIEKGMRFAGFVTVKLPTLN